MQLFQTSANSKSFRKELVLTTAKTLTIDVTEFNKFYSVTVFINNEILGTCSKFDKTEDDQGFYQQLSEALRAIYKSNADYAFQNSLNNNGIHTKDFIKANNMILRLLEMKAFSKVASFVISVNNEFF